MTADDVAAVVCAAPETRVIAVHMEAWNHCLLHRDRLMRFSRRASPERSLF